MSPTIGIDSNLSAACGAVENSETAFSASCLQAWYAQEPGPAQLGQKIAWELMYYKVRDGWNSLGTDGGCDAGPHFCPRYMDITGYNWVITRSTQKKRKHAKITATIAHLKEDLSTSGACVWTICSVCTCRSVVREEYEGMNRSCGCTVKYD